ncbi:unnamed protein product [Chrysodeixis includens]|uniref:GST C-terminal domain-containing protein n=1 Tax=Chrysodeixis includens TaxID=689277 RepID=A0A9P0C435_CHRIL|nr:unnamed protein product [Chrysodeixis includens]
MFFDASILFIRNRNVGMATIFEGLKAPTERHLSDLEEAYGMLERFLSKYRYVAANHLTIADISLATTLYVSVLIKEIDPSKYPRVTAWLKKMQQEPSYKKFAEPGSAIAKQTFDYFSAKNNQ